MTEEHPNQWWLTADKEAILGRIKATCETLTREVSTTELVELLFPETTARGAGIDRRQALFARLQSSAAKELAPYATRGEAVPSRFGPRRPWRWHKPAATCSRCQGTGVEP